MNVSEFFYEKMLTSFGNEVKDELEKCKDSGDIQKLVISKFGQVFLFLK